MFPQERILLCFAGSDKRKCERSVHYKVETLLDLKLVSSVTMAWLFISMQIRRLNMRRLPQQTTMVLHQLSVDWNQTQIRQRCTIFLLMSGVMPQNIHIMICKLSILSAVVFVGFSILFQVFTHMRPSRLVKEP